MTRTKLSQRTLPNYTQAEEILNTVTHIPGAVLGIITLILCSLRAKDAYSVTASIIYGTGMIAVFTISSVYHGLKPGYAKKVLQVVDHCTIYTLIAGTYTSIALSALRPAYPWLAW